MNSILCDGTKTIVRGEGVLIQNIDTEVTIFERTIPAGDLGDFSRMRFDAFGSLVASAAPPTITLRLYLGIESIAFVSAQAIEADYNGAFRLNVDVICRAVSNAQLFNTLFLAGKDQVWQNNAGFVDNITTGSCLFKITAQFSAAEVDTYLGVDECRLSIE